MSIAGDQTAQGRNSLLEASVNQFGIICLNLLKLSTHSAIKMLSLPKRTKKLPAKLRCDTIPLILKLGKQIQLRPELPNDQECSVLIFRQKASYLIFHTYPKQVIFPSSTTLDELFGTMLEKAKNRFPDLEVFKL